MYTRKRTVEKTNLIGMDMVKCFILRTPQTWKYACATFSTATLLSYSGHLKHENMHVRLSRLLLFFQWDNMPMFLPDPDGSYVHPGLYFLTDRSSMVLFSASDQTHCILAASDRMSDCSFTQQVLNIHWSGVLTVPLVAARLVPHSTAVISARVVYIPYNHVEAMYVNPAY